VIRGVETGTSSPPPPYPLRVIFTSLVLLVLNRSQSGFIVVEPRLVRSTAQTPTNIYLSLFIVEYKRHKLRTRPLFLFHFSLFWVVLSHFSLTL